MRYRFIEAHAGRFGVRLMCRALGVSRSGYYAWRRRPASARRRTDATLLERIRAVHQRSRGTYGSPRVHAELRAAGVRCGRHRVARLMREAGVVARGHRAHHGAARAAAPRATRWRVPNLVGRRFRVPTLDTVWASDITFVATREGWLYLAVVLDLASRRVVGRAIRPTLSQQLVDAALGMALAQRAPAPGLVHHSDRGAQYTSVAYQALLAAHGLRASLSSAGSCYDNAVVESFFHTLKTELLRGRGSADRASARAAIFEYVEVWYNRERRHSTLGYESPARYEACRTT